MTGSLLTATVLLLLGLSTFAQEVITPENREGWCTPGEGGAEGCCGIPPDIDIANGTWRNPNGQFWTREPTNTPRIIYQCRDGFRLKGERVRTCSLDNVLWYLNHSHYWSPLPPTCEPDPRRRCVTRWTDWSECDAACGGGFSYRNREIVVLPGPEAPPDPTCSSATENRTCNPQRCRVCELCDGVTVDHGTVTYLLKTDDLPAATDIIVVVDESRSMVHGQRWVEDLVLKLDRDLIANGIGATAKRPNLFALVGFGRIYKYNLNDPARRFPRHFMPASGRPLFRSSEFASAARNLISDGNYEDGYLAMEYAVNNITLSNGRLALRTDQPGIATNLIFISDEDRDIHPAAQQYTRRHVKQLLRKNGIVPNVVVDHKLYVGDERVVGVDFNYVAYMADALGNVRNETSGVRLGHPYKQTKIHYSSMALSRQLRGASWDIELLRNSRTGQLNNAFAKAFTTIKFREIITQARGCYICTCNADSPPNARLCVHPRNQRWCCLTAGGRWDQTVYPRQCFAPDSEA